MDLVSLELGGLILSFGSFITFFIWLYKNIFKPAKKIIESHDDLVKSINVIESELTPNSGTSIKDAIQRIEKHQLIIDQRSKAIFFSHDTPIFEVDSNGNIMWANEKFHEVMGHRNLNLLDWINFIDEPKRERFIKEFSTCSETGREIKFETISMEGERYLFHGFPYRCEKSKKSHGFLIYLILKEK